MAFAARIVDLLNIWRRRRAWQAATPPAGDAAATTTFPVESYQAALDRLMEIARDTGAREERARIAAIALLPQAAGFPQLALHLALTGIVSTDQEIEAFAAAERDVLARSQPTELAAPASDGRPGVTLH